MLINKEGSLDSSSEYGSKQLSYFADIIGYN